MILVSDVLPDVQRVLGGIDRAAGLARMNDAIEILSTETEWDPLRGYMDILLTYDGSLTQGASRHVITMPREVGTVLTVNINGRPTQAHDFWFQFHLNGPGNGCGAPCGFHFWDDIPVAIYGTLDTVNGNYLVCTLETATDNNVPVRIYGYDVNGNWIRTPNSITGLLEDGFLVPTVYGAPARNTNAPYIARITRVSLGAHVGKITLNTLSSTAVLTAVGQYYAGDVEPQYRRIEVGIGACQANERRCVRVGFRKAVKTLSLDTDLIPLDSKYALVMMVKSLAKIDSDRIDEAAKYHLMAITYLNKKQESMSPPGGPSIQMADNNLIADKYNRLDP